ncbi:MAG: hypothetical protein A2015_10575 [Spirochaetes bacterium GWF1_31_7]|nr:MAG: hypothetical protein A2Y30_16315 [Spirochaetes bacterium GWE1_32_154]OHD51458.1 MAG: hypothetical protein A2015_10575 [Spirochaetes bacterium GWF1_31_7]HBD93327.1 hypothetical protein [Spirochaetia bacterium]HBI36658.1 hypothetical protein [Spirochaetia bacterium]
MAKNKLQQSEFSENKSGYIPFILLFLIGLIKTETMTYHQKVFKTLLIIISAFIMIIYYFIDNYEEKKVKLERLTIFFGLFFLIFFIQYIVSYFSGEISYDRNYYLANYASLLIFAFFTYLYFKNENDLKKIFILIPVFLIILSSIAGFEFINYYTYPNRIDNLVMEQQLSKNLSPDEYKNLNQYYRLQSGSYRVNRSLSGSQKSTIHSLLKKSHYYTIVNPTKILSQYRPPLTFGNTNYLAAYLIALLPLAFLSGFALYDRKKKFINNYLSIICFFGAIAGTFPLILTQTTSAFFGIYLSIIFIVFPSIILTSTKLNRLTKIILISLTFLILFILPIILLINAPELFKTLAPRLVTKTKAPLFALYDRLNGWTPAWNLFLKHPITGAGLGTVYAASFQYISKYFYIYSSSNSFKHSHNEFVELLGEGGIVSILLFVSLISFITYKLISIFVSHANTKVLRYSALGTITGIIAVLLQQIFDLSLRMSVTMIAFYTLIGLAVFIIKESGKKESKWLMKQYELNMKIFLFICIILMVGAGLMFKPVFMSENNIMNSFIKYQNREEYLEKAVQYMKENPYAWTIRFEYHSSVVTKLINEYINNKESRIENEKNIITYFNKAIADLSTLQSIIPDYQDLWSKRVKLISDYNAFLTTKYIDENDKDLEPLIINNYRIMLSDLGKSINNNYLNYNNHLQRLSLLNRLNIQNEMPSRIKEVIEASLLLQYAKNSRVVKEKVIIQFSNSETSAIAQNEGYIFTINNESIELLVTEILKAGDNTALIDTNIKNFIHTVSGFLYQ